MQILSQKEKNQTRKKIIVERESLVKKMSRKINWSVPFKKIKELYGTMRLL